MPESFNGLTEGEAKEFAGRWLPAWTGDDPERLASFDPDDCFFSDPAVAEGVNGRAALTRYFGALLANFPDWEWTNTGVTPIPGGFLNHWHASIPVGATTVECDGVCTVVLRDGLIARNEVGFDRSDLLAAIAEASAGVE
jgi:SnoaL-like domain